MADKRLTLKFTEAELIAAALRRALRDEFLRLLTEDSPTQDRRRREFNQAIFDADTGRPVFHGTSLDMIMRSFDRAVQNLECR